MAIKTIPPSVLADSRTARALADEANVVMTHHHENIRAVLNLEEDRHNHGRLTPYLAMALVERLSLAVVLAMQPSGRMEYILYTLLLTGAIFGYTLRGNSVGCAFH